MGRRGPIVVVLGSVGLAALVAGSALVTNPEVFIPLCIESAALVMITMLLLRKVGDTSERRFVGRVVGIAAGARALVIGLVYGGLDPIFFAPDTTTYDGRGRRIAAFWEGLGPDPGASWRQPYEHLNAVAIRLLGDPEWALVVLNSFAALWTVMVAFVLARACFGPVAARVTAVLVAIFPSMILWSVLNIRDSIATLGVTVIVYLAVRLRGRVTVPDLALLGLGLLGLYALRDYMGVLVLAGLALGMAASARPDRMASTLAVGMLLIVALVFGLEQGGLLGTETLELSLESASRFRSNLQQDAGSVFGQGFEIDTPGQALRYLPVGLAFFLFAPFPWQVTTTLQVFTLPEVLVWYLLVPFVVLGFSRSASAQTRASLLALGVLIVTVSTYALVEGNFGTAYRHRAQVMPLFFIFAGKGLADWWARRKQRLTRERQRAARARAATFPGRRVTR